MSYLITLNAENEIYDYCSRYYEYNKRYKILKIFSRLEKLDCLNLRQEFFDRL